jgi:signal transduction histidine kinase
MDRDELIEAGMVLASELSLPAVLQRIIELAAEITDARYGALGVVSGDKLVDFITVGISPEERAAIGDLPVGHGILGLLIHRGTDRTPVRIADITEHPRSHGFPPHHPPMRSFLGAPVVARGEVFGDIYLTEKQGAEEFSEEDVAAILVLASQAAVAIENARLYDEATRARRELERLAVLEDRERIAKELHDGVIQALFAVGMGLQGAALMNPDADIAARIEGSVTEIDRVIRDLRNYIFGLRPGILADRQLDTALRSLVEEFSQKSGVTTVLELDETVAQDLTHVAGDVLQLTREALSNVGRHAGAATCRVSLFRRDGAGVLEVDDDGHGFDVATVRRGDGLTNVEQRVGALGGTVSFEADPAEGTTVRISVPL